MKTGEDQDQDDRRPRSGAQFGVLAQTRENGKVIRASMERWRQLNEYGRSIGRGLSQAELVDKVAGETGASKNHIHRSLKQED